jgi:hypothetical protein
MFSSIDEEKRAEVIQKCYRPLLDLAEKGIKVSLEASALTLEIIESIDPGWIEDLKELIRKKKIEFIGSGYSQIIAPIVPYEINIQNLKTGAIVYKELLDYMPAVYLMNEMAFSSDLISVYEEVGIKNIIIEWNNFYKYTAGVKKEYAYQPLQITNDKSKLTIVWADSICFQKFQRYIHGELEKSSLLNYLNKARHENSGRYLPVYSSDAEIFGFRPGRYKTENSLDTGEWQTIESLYREIEGISPLVFISEMLEETNSLQPLMKFESLFPIQVKKQEKYNIYRWAIGGRNNLKLNADCYKLLDHYTKNRIKDVESWKQLLFYWSSDFRTHITLPRFKAVNSKLESDLSAINYLPTDSFKSNHKNSEFVQLETNPVTISIDTKAYKLLLNRKKGLVIESFIPKEKGRFPVIGKIEHGTYDDITYSNDYFSGYAICYDNLRKQHTHLFNRLESIEEFKDRVVVKALNNCNDKFSIEDEMTAYSEYFEIKRRITIHDESLDIIHPFTFTFLPKQHLKYLKYQVSCGGSQQQIHPLNNWSLTTQQSKYLTISAINGISLTNGKIVIMDENELPQLHFEIDNCLSPLVLSFQYQEEVGIGDDKMPFCWMVMSAQEINDAYKGNTERSKIIESKIKIY